MRKSPLDDWHRTNGARMVEFADWELPVQYSSVVSEHKAVRSAAGLFDISHMGQIFVHGNNSTLWLQGLLTNDLSLLREGKGIYTHLCNARGGVIDDLFVFLLTIDRYFIVCNASREAAVLEWLRSHLQEGITLSPRIERGALALQGPKSQAIMEQVFPDAAGLKKREIIRQDFAAASALISRTGYTGEDGFEIFTDADGIRGIWEGIIDVDKSVGLSPCGLGARDTLRLEMGYALYGHELDEQTSPFEAGCGWVVKLNKGVPFIGEEALIKEKERGSLRKQIALVLDGRGVPREGCPVLSEEKRVGETTSGTFSPSMGAGICLALVDASANGPYCVDIRGRQISAREVKLPFVTPGSNKSGSA